MTYRRLCIGLVASMAALAATGAIADASDHDQLQEITVTATKRAELLQDVPAAVSALTGDTLQLMGAESLSDFARSIPGLTFSDAGAGRQSPAIRGINATVGSRTVGYYIGETPVPDTADNATPVPNSALTSPYLVDIERIEVLRGPQGTLYGSGSLGGTIKLVPNQPNLTKFEGSVQGTAVVTQGEGGASPGGEGTLILNAPLVEGVAGVRLVLWERDLGGFINRTYGTVGTFDPANHPIGTVSNLPDEHTWGFRGLGLYKPSDELSISTLAYIQHQHFDGFTDITGGVTNPGNRLLQVMVSDSKEAQEDNFALYSIDTKYDTGKFNIVSSSGFSTNSTVANMEGASAVNGFLGGPAFPNSADTGSSSHQFTEELRVATSESFHGFDGVLGFFYANYQASGEFSWSPPQYNALVAGNDPTNPLYAPNNALYNNSSTSYQRQTAEFGELTYHPIEALSATVGLRHFRVLNGTSESTDGYFLTPGSDAPQFKFYSAETEGNVHKGNLSYKITPDHLVYAQYSEGFRPGFGNGPLPAICNSPPGALQVQPDSTKNYELGAKTMWLDRRLSINAAAYRINWDGIQQFLLLKCGFPYITNFGSAVIKGGEIEINDQITRSLSAGVSGTYLSAKLQQSVPTLGAEAGDQIEQVPTWQFSAYGEVNYPLLSNVDGYSRLDFQYTGSSWGNYNRLASGARDPESEVEVIRLLNFKTGVRTGPWEFSFSVANLLNQIAIESIDANDSITLPIPGRPRLVVTRPRTFFMNAIFKF